MENLKYLRFSNPIEVTSPINYYVDTILDFVDPVLNNNSWATISEVARAGLASNIWKIGDWKYLDMTKYDYEVTVDSGYYGPENEYYTNVDNGFYITNKDIFLRNINYTPGTYQISSNGAPEETIIGNGIHWYN
jgi:hypothetical protein